MKRSILILLFSLVAIFSYGQSARLVHGCVHGKGKVPIEGALITTVQGELICKTDAGGQFQASTKSYITQIKVSHEGYGSQIVHLDGSYLIVNLSGRTPQAKRTLAPVKRGYEQEIAITNQLFFNSESMMLNINYMGGYRFGPHLFVGIGTGLDFDIFGGDGMWPSYREYYYHKMSGCNCDIYSHGDFPLNIVTIPVYAHIRTYLSKKRCAPFFGFSGGMRISTDTNNSNNDVGLSSSIMHAMGEVSMGLNIRCSNSFALNFQIGFPFGTYDIYNFEAQSMGKAFDFGYTARVGFLF